MKKWISCLLAAAIIFVTMGAHAVTVSAETTAKTNDQKFEMKTNASSLNTGETVEVTFHIHGGAASGFEGYLVYDATALRIVDEEVTPAEYSYKSQTTVDGVTKEEELSGKWEYFLYNNNRLYVWSKNGVVKPKSKDELVLTIRFYVKKSVPRVNIGLENLWVDRDFGREPENNINLQIVNSKAKNFSLGTDKVPAAVVGEMIQVPVKFTSTNRFSSLEISASFDPTKLIFDSVTLPDEFKKNVKYTVGLLQTQSQLASKVPVKFNMEVETSGSNKTLCYLNFRVLNSTGSTGTGTSSTAADTTTTVDIVAEEVTNQAGDVFVLDEAKAYCQVTITRKNQSTGSTGRTKLVILGTDSVSGYDMVTVPVNLMVNEGFSSLGISATFDPAKLIYDSVVISDVYKNNVQLESYTMSQTGSKLTVNLASKGDIKTTGALMYLNFRVSNLPATSGTGTQASATKLGPTPVVLNVETVDKLTPTELQYVATTTSVVTITEREHLAGDVNGNNRIDLIDVLYVIQYYNNVKKFTDVEFRAADMDKNGVVNLIDARIMLQYYDSEL